MTMHEGFSFPRWWVTDKTAQSAFRERKRRMAIYHIVLTCALGKSLDCLSIYPDMHKGISVVIHEFQTVKYINTFFSCHKTITLCIFQLESWLLIWDLRRGIAPNQRRDHLDTARQQVPPRISPPPLPPAQLSLREPGSLAMMYHGTTSSSCKW